MGEGVLTIICEDFQYNGHALSDFNLQLCDPEQEQQFAGRELERGEISSVRSSPNHYSAKYQDTLILYFLIMKDDCMYERQEDMKMSGDDINLLMSWLDSPKMPQILKTIPANDEVPTYYYGVFTDIQPYIETEECYGLYLTFTCNAPYGYSAPLTKECDIDSAVGDFEISYDNLSCERSEYCYPTITIYAEDTFSGSEEVQFTNHSDDDRTMILTMPEGKSVLRIDCRKKLVMDEHNIVIPLSKVGMEVSDSNDDYCIISVGTYSMYWLGLLPGKNELEISTLTSNTIPKIEISANFPRKADGF